MTLSELEDELPNGLHDAQIMSISRDFETGNLTLEICVLTGLPDDPPEVRDEYRSGFLTFTGVELLTIESPDASSAFLASGSLWFSVTQDEAGALPDDIAKKLTQGMFVYSFFVFDWHSSFHIAASDMRFGWRESAGQSATGRAP